MEINKIDKSFKLQIESDPHYNEGVHKSSEEIKSEYEELFLIFETPKDSQSSMSDDHDEYDNYNCDECYREYSSDKGSIRSTFEDWLER